MKQKTEKNKHNKGRPYGENIFTTFPKPYEDLPDKFIKKGFVAWPKGRYSPVKKIGKKIVGGRTKSGGYVAYPKEPPAKQGMNMYRPNETS